MWVCAPPEGEKQESSDPRTDRARVAVELAWPKAANFALKQPDRLVEPFSLEELVLCPS
jgi:hypothetical protein